jgi:hypothetical protein
MEAHGEDVEAELCAVDAVATVAVAGGQIGALSPGQVETVIIACRIMAGMSRLGENARGRWNRMGGTTRESGAKPYPPSRLHRHRRSQKWTTESREYRSQQYLWLRFVFL